MGVVSRTFKFLLLASVVLGTGCGEAFVDPLPPRDRLHWPIGLQVHPNGDFLYVVNSNFDTRFREDLGGTVSVIDLVNFEILPDRGPFIPSFGGKMQLNGDASKVYVSVRLENQVMALDVAPDGSAISCDESGEPSSDGRACSLSRVPDRSQGAELPSDPFGLDVVTTDVRQSVTVEAALEGTYTVDLVRPDGNANQVAFDATSQSEEDIAAELAAQIDLLMDYTASANGTRLAIEPINDEPFTARVFFDPPMGQDAPEEAPVSVLNESVDLLGLAHLRSQNVTSISLPGQSLDTATMKYAELINGSNDVAHRPGTRDFYVAGRASRDIIIYQPYLNEQNEVQAIIDRGRITLNHLTSQVDTRALLFEPDGDTLYAVSRFPDAIHTIDLRQSDAERGTGQLNRVIRSTPIERRPSDITRHLRITDNRPLLYIPCFEAQLIQVFDPQLDAVIDEIELGARPYDFVTDAGPNCVPGSGRCLAYVSLFDDLPRAGGSCEEVRDQPCGSVGVIDLDPLSPRYHQLVAKIF